MNKFRALLALVNLDIHDDWKKLHTFVVTWVFVVIGASGDVYNVLSNSGIIGQAQIQQNFLFIIHLLSVFGILTKVFKAKLKEVQDNALAEATKVQETVIAPPSQPPSSN